ncbi:MAG: hypothetical protein LBO63_03695 [Oscillospiraceae bacterium]|jgi:hypothetical protein|nr:hypothetical protein [Oscillospiraceae bacterium]
MKAFKFIIAGVVAFAAIAGAIIAYLKFQKEILDFVYSAFDEIKEKAAKLKKSEFADYEDLAE